MGSGYTKTEHFFKVTSITINQKDSEHGHFKMEIKFKEFTIKSREQILMMKIKLSFLGKLQVILLFLHEI